MVDTLETVANCKFVSAEPSSRKTRLCIEVPPCEIRYLKTLDTTFPLKHLRWVFSKDCLTGCLSHQPSLMAFASTSLL